MCARGGEGSPFRSERSFNRSPGMAAPTYSPPATHNTKWLETLRHRPTIIPMIPLQPLRLTAKLANKMLRGKVVRRFVRPRPTKNATNMLRGRKVHKILRRRLTEFVMEFEDGSTLFVGTETGELTFRFRHCCGCKSPPTTGRQ